MYTNIYIKSYFFSFIRVLFPVFAAFCVGALLLLLLGKNPIEYYAYTMKRALFTRIGFEAVLLRMTPLLFICTGLMIAFKTGIWNLGTDGQFLLAAVMTAAIAPQLAPIMPLCLLALICLCIAMITAILWVMLPAMLKIKHGVNEVITTLMMSFIGVSFANILIKFPFRDIHVPHPQTFILPLDNRLPRLFDSTVHVGLIMALFAVLSVHYLMKHSSLGVRLTIVGLNTKMAHHAGFNVPLLTYVAFFASAAFIGLAGAIEILGVYGSVQASWNPAYGMLSIPLVFLARFNGLLIILFSLLFSVLLVGGESASRVLDLPTYFITVLLALFMVFAAITELLYAKIYNHTMKKNLHTMKKNLC